LGKQSDFIDNIPLQLSEEVEKPSGVDYRKIDSLEKKIF